MFLEAYKHDAGVEFPKDAQEGDATVVVTVAPVTPILAEGDNLGISHALRHGCFSPTLAENILKRLQ